MALCYRNHKFLYEARPDIFPEGYLTLEEQLLWDKFYQDLDAARKARKRKK